MYPDLSFGSRQARGSCQDLTNLITDTFATLTISYFPTKLVMNSITETEFLTYDISTWSPAQISSTISCTQGNTPSLILNSLLEMQSSTDVTENNFICGNNTWTITRCTSGQRLVLCVNCKGYCALGIQDSRSLPYVISCDDPSTSLVGKAVIFDVEFAEKLPPPSLSILSVIPSQRTLLVRLRLSNDGSVACAAYESSKSIQPTSLQSILKSNQLKTVNSSQMFFDYHIENLIPSTSYDVYCASSSLSGISLSRSLILQTKQMTSTKCCRILRAVLSTVPFTNNKDISSALVLAIDSVPTHLLTVSVNATSLNTGDTVFPFQPRTSQFGGGNLFSQVQFTYIRTSPGTYRLNVDLSGPASDKYSVMFPVTNRLTVLGFEEEPSPPKMKSITYSSDGNTILIKFWSPTNQGGFTNRMSCSTFFLSTGLTLRTSCLWVDKSTITILNSNDHFIQVGDNVTLKAGVVKAECTVESLCSNWKMNDLQTLTVLPPSVGTIPTVRMAAPDQIGPCDDYVLDLSSSTGFGGRSWKSVSISVRSSNPNTTSLQSYLTTINSLARPISISKSYFTSGAVYNFAVTLCNFLDFCGTGVKVLIVSSSNNNPVALLDSRNSFSIFR